MEGTKKQRLQEELWWCGIGALECISMMQFLAWSVYECMRSEGGGVGQTQRSPNKSTAAQHLVARQQGFKQWQYCYEKWWSITRLPRSSFRMKMGWGIAGVGGSLPVLICQSQWTLTLGAGCKFSLWGFDLSMSTGDLRGGVSFKQQVICSLSYYTYVWGVMRWVIDNRSDQIKQVTVVQIITVVTIHTIKLLKVGETEVTADGFDSWQNISLPIPINTNSPQLFFITFKLFKRQNQLQILW